MEVDCFQNFQDTADHTILEGYIGSPKTVRYQVATLVVWWEHSTKLQELGTFWRLPGSLATSQDPGPSR